MDYESVNVLYRSRITLLKILSDRGYNTKAYEKFGPIEVSAMAAAGSTALRMDFEKTAANTAVNTTEENNAVVEANTEVQEGGAGTNAGNIGSGLPKCRVVYSLNRIKNRINTFVQDLTDSEEHGDDAVDPTTTEVIVILLEPIAEAFHIAALSAMARPAAQRLHISFFQAHTLVNNPLEHVLVPKHERLPPSQHAAFLKAHKIKSKKNLPIIKFHEDMIARILGLQPGDIVKITRPSPSAGIYEAYRLCAP